MYPPWAAGQRVLAAQLAAIPPAVAVKTALTSRPSQTALADDPHLALPLAAGGVYILDGAWYYNGEYSAGNLSADWAVPAGTTMRWAINGPALGGAAAFASHSTIPGQPIAAGTYGLGGANSLTSCHPTGHIVAGAAGDLRLRWAQNSSHPTATTLFAPSWIRLQRIS